MRTAFAAESGFTANVYKATFVPTTAGGVIHVARAWKLQRIAMVVAIAVGFGMLLGKGLAYLWTGSAAILSDALESLTHVAAVSLATISLWRSRRPPDRNHLYGHEKFGLLSVGFEGGMILVAGLGTLFAAGRKLIQGAVLEQLALGVGVEVATVAINGILGLYLLHVARTSGSLVLKAHGVHVLTDSWTSLGVLGAFAAVYVSGRPEFDPAIAAVIGANMLYTGVRLLREALAGLLDEADPIIDAQLRRLLEDWQARTGGTYHALRHRSTGTELWVETHLLFPDASLLLSAHQSATALEEEIEKTFPQFQVVATTHLEPLEGHADQHSHPHATHIGGE